MLMRFDPFRDVDRLAEQAWEPFRGLSRYGRTPMDAVRHGDEVIVTVDLPGVNPDSVDLTVEKNVLTLKAERNWEPAEGDEVIVAERPRGTFSRQLFLGESLDAGGVSAHYDAGVLTVRIPVAEQAKPRRVEISGGGGHGQAIDAASKTA
jgi:HSP20 family protein